MSAICFTATVLVRWTNASVESHVPVTKRKRRTVLPRARRLLLEQWKTPSPTPLILMQDDNVIDIEVPKTFEQMQAQATDNGIAGLRQGEPLIEINFPSVPNIATAALNQLLDANRVYVRRFVQACATRLSSSYDEYYIIFPDKGEMNLARKSYRGEVKNVCTFSNAPDMIPSGGNGVIVVVQPGFNVDEYIDMESLEQFNMPIVSINGDLDKIRSDSYYPKWFYPKLHKVRTRFLTRFKETYYIKFLSNNGTLIKLYDRPWTLFYKTGIIWQDADRPQFKMVEKLLSQAKQDDLLSSSK